MVSAVVDDFRRIPGMDTKQLARVEGLRDNRELGFVIDPGDPEDVVLEIDVEATRRLQTGERAVVDVSPLTLHPAER